MQSIDVLKRDGARELFDPSKIRRVVLAAQLPEDKADQLIKNIVAWIEELDQKEITSIKIRDQVQSELTKLHRSSADLFAWYQKTKV